jgi:acetyl esterase/lipase
MIHHFRTTAAALLFLVFWGEWTASLALEKAKPQAPEGVVYVPDVEYGKGGDQPLTLHLAMPEKLDKPAPCIVVIHGGAWRAGDKSQHVAQIFEFAKKGYVSVSIGYRFCPKHTFPAQVEDAKCAVRFLRANAEKYHIDPPRFGAIGFSAGAHLSMMLGVMGKEDGLEGSGGSPDQSSKVQAVVAFFGPTDFNAEDIPAVSVGLVNDFVGVTKENDKGERKKASPITYVTKDDAPLLIFQGTKDPLVPHTQAYKMTDAMTAAGVPGRVELLLGAGHGWGGKEIQRSLAQTLDFFGEKLKHN